MRSLLTRLFTRLLGPFPEGMAPYTSVMLTFFLPLPLALRLIGLFAAAKTPDYLPAVYFARTQLRVPRSDLRAWFRKSWWGSAANNAVGVRNTTGHQAQLLKILDPVDWTLVDRTRAQGRGLVITSSHFGPHGVLGAALEASGRKAFIVAQRPGKLPGGGTGAVPGGKTHMQFQYLQAHAHLREGGILAIAPDGPVRANVPKLLFGRPWKFGDGAARLTHKLGTPTVFSFAAWTGYRLHLTFSGPLEPQGQSLEAWFDIWFDAYITHLEQCVRNDPYALRFRGMLRQWEHGLAQEGWTLERLRQEGAVLAG